MMDIFYAVALNNKDFSIEFSIRLLYNRVI